MLSKYTHTHTYMYLLVFTLIQIYDSMILLQSYSSVAWSCSDTSWDVLNGIRDAVGVDDAIKRGKIMYTL